MRSWLVIPAMGAVCGGAALALGLTPALALVGAALAAVVRMLAGDTPAQLTAAVIAPGLALASLAEAGGDLTRAAVALAAAGWAIAELARPFDPRTQASTVEGAPVPAGGAGGMEGKGPRQISDAPSPLPAVAVAPAVVAAVLDPSFVALVAITGARLVSIPWRPWQRPRWVIAVPIAGALAIALAVLAGTVWPALGSRWFGAAAKLTSVPALAAATAATLGPLTAVAALAGVAALARPRAAELAIAAVVAGALLVDLRAGAPGKATIGLAALLAGLAIGRLAALIRIPSGQALAGATAGLLILLPPAWAALDRPRSAHTGRASR